MRRAYGDSCRRGFGGDSRESRWLSIRTEEYNQRGRRHTAKGAVPGSVSPARSFSCWPTPMKKWGWCGRRLRVVLLLSIVLFVSLLVLLLIWDIACIPTGAAPTTTPFPSSVSFLSSVPFLSYHPSPLVPSFVLRRTVSLHVPYPNHHRYSNGGDRMKSMEEREEAMKENSAQEREDPATYLLDGSELDLYAWKRRRIIRWSQTGLSFKGPHLHDTRVVVGVLSTSNREGADRRRAIRKTWFQLRSPSHSVPRMPSFPSSLSDGKGGADAERKEADAWKGVFVVGLTSDKATAKALALENATYGDLLLVRQPDVYNTEDTVLPAKTAALFMHVGTGNTGNSVDASANASLEDDRGNDRGSGRGNNRGKNSHSSITGSGGGRGHGGIGGDRVKWLFKCEDDSFVHMGKLLRLLDRLEWNVTSSFPASYSTVHTPSAIPPPYTSSRGNEKRFPYAFFGGSTQRQAVPMRDPADRWFISQNDWPARTFPPFAMGGGYLLSRDWLHCAVDGAIRSVPFEDVQTGLMAERCGVSLSDIEGGFFFENLKDIPPHLQDLSSHKDSFISAHAVDIHSMYGLWHIFMERHPLVVFDERAHPVVWGDGRNEQESKRVREWKERKEETDGAAVSKNEPLPLSPPVKEVRGESNNVEKGIDGEENQYNHLESRFDRDRFDSTYLNLPHLRPSRFRLRFEGPSLLRPDDRLLVGVLSTYKDIHGRNRIRDSWWKTSERTKSNQSSSLNPSSHDYYPANSGHTGPEAIIEENDDHDIGSPPVSFPHSSVMENAFQSKDENEIESENDSDENKANKDMNGGWTGVFVIADPMTEDSRNKLLLENATHGDILLLDGIVEIDGAVASSRPAMVVALFRHALTLGVKYVVKADNEAVIEVKVPELLRELAEREIKSRSLAEKEVSKGEQEHNTKQEGVMKEGSSVSSHSPHLSPQNSSFSRSPPPSLPYLYAAASILTRAGPKRPPISGPFEMPAERWIYRYFPPIAGGGGSYVVSTDWLSCALNEAEVSPMPFEEVMVSLMAKQCGVKLELIGKEETDRKAEKKHNDRRQSIEDEEKNSNERPQAHSIFIQRERNFLSPEEWKKAEEERILQLAREFKYDDDEENDEFESGKNENGKDRDGEKGREKERGDEIDIERDNGEEREVGDGLKERIFFGRFHEEVPEDGSLAATYFDYYITKQTQANV